MKKLSRYSFKEVEKFLRNAERRNHENKFLFEIIFSITSTSSMFLLSEILDHPEIKEMGIQLSELDYEDQLISIPIYKDNCPEEKRQLFYNKINAMEILEIVSIGLTESQIYKRRPEQEAQVELIILQRINRVELKIIFFGYHYLKIKEEEIEITLEE